MSPGRYVSAGMGLLKEAGSGRFVANFYNPDKTLPPSEQQTLEQANADAYLALLARTQFTKFIGRLRELDTFLDKQRGTLNYLMEQRRRLQSLCTSLSPLAIRHGAWLDVRQEMPPSFDSVMLPDNPELWTSGVSVQVIVWHGMASLANYHQATPYKYGSWLIDGYGFQRSEFVTHWMTLPAPPTENQERFRQ